MTGRLEPSSNPIQHLDGSGYCLVLGGSGFVGRHVAVLLARAGERVLITGRARPKWDVPIELQGRIQWRHLELATADWETVLHGAWIVYHCAWSTVPASAHADPLADVLTNVLPTIKLLQTIQRCSPGVTLVFLSSGGCVYGKPKRIPIREDDPLLPTAAYGASKAAIELCCRMYRRRYGVDCRIARLSNPFGVGQDLTRGQGAATLFLHRALAGQTIEIWGDGSVVRDYIHVSDAAEGLVALGYMSWTNGPYTFNICSGRGISLNSVVEEISSVLDRKLEVNYRSPRAFDVPVNVLDGTRAARFLG